MRLWSLHPRYLDRRALVALWREGLLAQAVLRGATRGYRAHPQLLRFRQSGAPLATLAAYLRRIHEEATRRGYSFDARKLPSRRGRPRRLAVTRGQLAFELEHLREKVARRERSWLHVLPASVPAAHPAFAVVRGEVEPWERGHRLEG